MKANIIGYETEIYSMTQEAVDYMMQRDGRCHVPVDGTVAITYDPEIFVAADGEFARISWRDAQNRINHNFIPIDLAQRIEAPPPASE